MEEKIVKRTKISFTHSKNHFSIRKDDGNQLNSTSNYFREINSMLKGRVETEGIKGWTDQKTLYLKDFGEIFYLLLYLEDMAVMHVVQKWSTSSSDIFISDVYWVIKWASVMIQPVKLWMQSVSYWSLVVHVNYTKTSSALG